MSAAPAVVWFFVIMLAGSGAQPPRGAPSGPFNTRQACEAQRTAALTQTRGASATPCMVMMPRR